MPNELDIVWKTLAAHGGRASIEKMVLPVSGRDASSIPFGTGRIVEVFCGERFIARVGEDFVNNIKSNPLALHVLGSITTYHAAGGHIWFWPTPAEDTEVTVYKLVEQE